MSDIPLHPAVTDPFPVRWNPSVYASNPVINVINNPDEVTQTEQYIPAPIQLANGDIWVYVKGHVTKIYAWKSTDGGVTFSLQNGGSAVLAVGGAGTWDSQYCLQPSAVYDQANDLIHLYYGGSNDPSLLTGFAAGHATAPGSTPNVFTKDASNPIITMSSMATTFGGGTAGNECAISSVIKIGSTFHFYGDCIYNGSWCLWHATGTTWNNPSNPSIILTAPVSSTDTSIVQWPSVFSYGGGYGMIYAMGGQQPSYPRALRAGASTDGVNWTFYGDNIISPAGPQGSPPWDYLERYSSGVLKSSTDPFSAPIVDANGRWKLYFSGYNGTAANVGLCYLVPS